jgi:ABC-2 type transport system permease protein
MENSRRIPFPWPLLRFWTSRVLPAWCFIAFWIFLFQLIVCGIVHDNQTVKAFLQYIDLLPSFVKAVLGGKTLQVGNVAALIAIGYQDPLILFLYMLYAIGVPTALLAGEIQRGNMELILSRRVTKTHVYICAGLITIVGMYALVLVMFLGTLAGTNLYRFNETVPIYNFFRLAINSGILASAVGGIALFAAASFQRTTAVSVTVAYLVINYIISIVSQWWPQMQWLEPTTILHYVNGVKIFSESIWPIGDMGVLLLLLVISALLGGIIWRRRDLPL